ncbi:MAG: CBS domain-containing protein [Bacteroidales bacterium]|nr:CBS domain-containing protein [Bacteroidales bacterium]MBR4213771.1 CBS domain-containing protein [Bacteroidales bacterium]
MLTDLISTNIPALKPDDTGETALQIMDDFRVSHLPVVSGTEYLGLVSDNDIYEIGTESPVSECHLVMPQPYALENQHIFEILTIVTSQKLSLVPILSPQNNAYLGVITESQLLRGLASATAADISGGIVEIITTPTNFSPALITSIVENNDMKVMSLFANSTSDSVEAVIKLNGHDTSAVIQGLERYGYRIKSVYEGDGKYNDLMEERYGALMNYLNV